MDYRPKPMPDDRPVSAVTELNKRSREIFRLIVDSYVNNGEPVGSRTVARQLGSNLSAATVRNVMADLEEAGMLYAPHTSAGRLPTEAGLNFFVHGLLQLGEITGEDRESLDERFAGGGYTPDMLMQEASSALAGLSSCAGLVMAQRTDRPLKQVEFVRLGPGRALVVLVTDDGQVENRVIEIPLRLPHSALVQATNYLNARIAGRTLAEAHTVVAAEIESRKAQLDQLTEKVVAAGLAAPAGGSSGQLIVKGQARLLEDVTAIEDLERIRTLFSALEEQESILKLLDNAESADGVQIFIGAENSLFQHSGCSLIMSSYKNTAQELVGAIGVIGPSRLNYGRIIPMVDYTARLLSRLMGEK